MKKRALFTTLLSRLSEPRAHIQVLLGPRQVGKTTLALQVAESLELPSHYASADFATLQNLSWLRHQWEIGRRKIRDGKGAVLIIDEIQKISSWSEMVKSLWDEDSRKKTRLSVLILGSSPWLMQKGLTESLAGRFEIIPATHWNYEEMKRIFHWDLDRYVYFGGYPGAAALVDEENISRWANYINDSLIETTISRDILLMTQINKPALLRRLFQLACCYSGQILSYNKILGELDAAGNTTTLAHYAELLSGVGLVGSLQKYASQKVRQKGSSPKFCVCNTALMTAQSQVTFHEARDNHQFWGRLVESAVGAYLLNASRGLHIDVFYWREKDKEVDFVLQRGKSLTAIEVKTGHGRCSGMDAFIAEFNPSKTFLVGDHGTPLEEFLSMPITEMV